MVVDEEEVDQSLVLQGEDMTGAVVDQVEDAEGEDQQVQRPVRGHKAPYQPSTKEVELHNYTHMAYRSWCPYCVAARRPNAAHKRVDEERSVPLIASDYAYIRDSRDQELLTILVCKILPYQITLAMAVEHKGVTAANVERVSSWLKEVGLTKFVYKSDQEPSIIALFEAAAQAAGKQMSQEREDAVVATPEHSSVGESASNGIAERAVQSVEDIVRTCKLALEARIGKRIPSTSPILCC